MPVIIWTDKLSIGVAEIDNQHRRLVALINELHDAIAVGRDRETLAKVLDELMDYTFYHFDTEERLMRDHRYMERGLHENQHRELTKTAAELQAAVKTGNANLTWTTLHFLKDWLNHHILGADLNLGRFLNSKGIR